MSALPEAQRALHAVRERLAARDYYEVINFSFVEPAWEADFAGCADPIRLLNPIASPQSVMRSSLIGSLVENVRYNLARKVERVRVFEIGRAFLREPGAADGPLSVAGLRQPMRVGAAAFGPALEAQWGEPLRGVDFFDVKADVEALFAPLGVRFEAGVHPALHPGRAARVLSEDREVGWVGELHPQWQRKYELPGPVVLVELDAAALERVPLPRAEVPSRFPTVVRDISMLFDAAIPAQAVLDAIYAERPGIVRQVGIFDLYQGKGLPERKKSLALRVVMQDTERTLTDVEADEARDAIVALLTRMFSATLRS